MEAECLETKYNLFFLHIFFGKRLLTFVSSEFFFSISQSLYPTVSPSAR